MDELAFYPNAEKYGWEATLRKGIREETITAQDESLIREYLEEKKANDHIQLLRVNKITSILVNFRRFLTRPYSEAGMGDVFAAINGLKEYRNLQGKPYTQNTIHTYVQIVKPYLLWLIENEYSALPEKKVKKLTGPGVDVNTTEPEDLWSVEEIQKLIEACKYSRDRAVVSLLYESGCRISELGRLRWKDATFDPYGVKLYLDDRKEDKKRYARLTMARAYLATWKADCPDASPDAPMFTNLQDKSPVEYITIIRLLERLKKDAGITKRLTPHLFRHSRITHMIAQNYQESVIKKTMWNNLNTKMLETYVSLGEDDIDAEMLERQGIQRKKVTAVANPLAPVPCPNCHTPNRPQARFCDVCGRGLSDEAVAEEGELKQDVVNDPEALQDLIDRRIAEALKKRGEQN
ncbi:MAG: tyrosine-type recombinase/integrase [Methanomicrobiales archaeon]|nr:tyrosine-type recombinase/integrase [Methanomicrobiales archaeon]